MVNIDVPAGVGAPPLDTQLCLPRSRVSECDDAQVVSCHHYLVIFRLFVEQLARRLLYQL